MYHTTLTGLKSISARYNETVETVKKNNFLVAFLIFLSEDG